MKVIGGFYELLIPRRSFNYHAEAVALTNGRACIRTIIQNESISKCYVPNFTCDAVYHPFALEHIEIELYQIDEYLQPVNFPQLRENEYFYYINYFGVKTDIVLRLLEHYADKLIIDNTHSFFKKRVANNWSFTSARKYFGVPDGAFLYSPRHINTPYPRYEGISVTHSFERLKGNQQKAFEAYTAYEKSLDSNIALISLFSEKMLSLVDIEQVKSKRLENFQLLHNRLEPFNTFKFELAEDDIPFAYPFLPAEQVDKTVLYKDNIFIPSLWTDPLKRPENSSSFELKLASDLLPLPVDERYDIDDIGRLSENIFSLLKK